MPLPSFVASCALPNTYRAPAQIQTDDSLAREKGKTAKDTKRTRQFLRHPYVIEHEGLPFGQTTGRLTIWSVVLEAGKSLIRRVQTGSANAECGSAMIVINPYAIESKDGERGRNRTYNLLIKSHVRHIHPDGRNSQ